MFVQQPVKKFSVLWLIRSSAMPWPGVQASKIRNAVWLGISDDGVSHRRLILVSLLRPGFVAVSKKKKKKSMKNQKTTYRLKKKKKKSCSSADMQSG